MNSENNKTPGNDKVPVYSFKKVEFSHSTLKNNKKRVWKNLKQIMASEKNYIWPSDAVLYSHIEAPPSFTPTKKYSDVSGLPAHYTDPMTKLRFSNASEFHRIRSLPIDIVNGLLEVRKASSIVG